MTKTLMAQLIARDGRLVSSRTKYVLSIMQRLIKHELGCTLDYCLIHDFYVNDRSDALSAELQEFLREIIAIYKPHFTTRLFEVMKNRDYNEIYDAAEGLSLNIDNDIDLFGETPEISRRTSA